MLVNEAGLCIILPEKPWLYTNVYDMKIKNVWGKLIGCVLGFALGGPLGAILGMIVGHIYDNQPQYIPESWDDLSQNYAGFNGNSQQLTFTIGVIVLGAKMAKADGRVNRAEIDTFKRVFRIAPEQTASVGRIFDQARKSVEGFEPYALRLAQTFRYNPLVLEEILGGLFMIAAADSAGISLAELRFLQSVAVIFSFEKDDFTRIAARAGVRIPNTGPHPGQTPRQEAKLQDESYAILGLKEDAGVEDIKSAYRNLILQYHPDKLMAQGLPPEYISTASEKMKRINVAYDKICKSKGIK